MFNIPDNFTLKLAGAGGGILILLYILDRIFNRRKRFLAELRRKKNAKTAELYTKLRIHLENQKISPETVTEIVDLSFTDLLDRLKNGKLDQELVLKAYQIRALEIHDKTNCLTDPIIEARPSNAKGAFYGIPLSVKDNYQIKGYDTTLGCSKYLGEPATENSTLIEFLIKNGAIPFVKTNIPQTLVSWETNNPIFGPTNLLGFNKRNPGGSSGGEAVLLSGNGSILGLGSDIGGSLRIPSNMNGTYTLKLTPNRIGNRGTKGVQIGQDVVRSCYGPMTRDVDTIHYFMENVLVDEYFKMDPLAFPMPFNKQEYNSTRKLRIGYYDSLDYIKSVPVVRRAVQMAKEKLEKKGYELVPYKLPDVEYGLTLFISSLFGDNGKSIADATKDDELSSAIKLSAILCQISKPMKYIIGKIGLFVNPSLGTAVLNLLRIRSVTDWWRHTDEVNRYRNKVWDEWNDMGLDAVICPTFPCPAIGHGKFGLAAPASYYTGVYNLLSCPAGSLPMTRVTKQDEIDTQKYVASSTPEKIIKEDFIQGSVGLPCNVQVVTRPFKDELCLRVMKDLEVSSV